jgi:hypothetical protein
VCVRACVFCVSLKILSVGIPTPFVVGIQKLVDIKCFCYGNFCLYWRFYYGDLKFSVSGDMIFWMVG